MKRIVDAYIEGIRLMKRVFEFVCKLSFLPGSKLIMKLSNLFVLNQIFLTDRN